ncbi:uncharacterized protein LOC135693981 [Rhopilema esculentum]|uniref:uncharacterized protein LOC135693981 n=1 Tax=Rhopilema esculentum TaxID=499914 RepID=UPI0031DEED74|eukprot:gene2797-1020_t
MAANKHESLPVEELDDILYLINEGFLEEDEELNSQIEDIAIEVTRDEENPAGFECNVCGKACKSRRGLSRHTNSKHRHVTSSSDAPVSSLSSAAQTSSSSNYSADEISRQKLHPLQLKAIVLKCAEKISSDECFPSSLRDHFSKGLFIFTNDDAVELWSKLRKVIDSFKGDAEKFYSGFFSLLVVNVLPSKFEESFVTNTLMSEVANLLLSHLSGVENLDGTKEPESLSAKEEKSLQYLAGFILHKLYSKFFYSTKSRDINQQILSLLQACKVEIDESQTLINALDRGGLWRVNNKVQKVFLRSELLFRARTASFKTKLACEDLVSEILKDPSVLSNYNDICLNASLEISKEVSMDLLEHMLTIYFRVRTFSFAKDIREKHKISKKLAKKRSLRTEIKKSSSTDTLQKSNF